jgi:hypothetical protein
MGRCIRQYHKYGWIMDWNDLVDLEVGTHAHRSRRWFEQPPHELVQELHDMPQHKQSLAALIDTEYRYHASLNDQDPERWGDKAPGNVFHAEAISEVFPGAKFIHLLRDGVDVVSSWIRYAPYTDDLEGAIQKWRWSVRLAREFLDAHPEKGIEVRYEDLVRDPEREMRTICDFLGLSFAANQIEDRDPLETMGDVVGLGLHQNITRSISTDGIGKGRRNLSEAQKQVVKDEIDEALLEMGYEPVSV